jgi:hypothetical protein
MELVVLTTRCLNSLMCCVRCCEAYVLLQLFKKLVYAFNPTLLCLAVERLCVAAQGVYDAASFGVTL